MKRISLIAIIIIPLLFWIVPTVPAQEDTPGTSRTERISDGVLQSRLETVPGVKIPRTDNPSPAFIPEGIQPSPFGTDDFVGELLWQVGDATGMCNDCAVSPDGNYLALGISLNNERAELYEILSSIPVWQYPVPGETWGTMVAISENCDVYAFSSEHYLRIFDSTSGTPIWTYDYGASASSGPVAVSRDGSLIVALSIDGEDNHITAFGPGSSTPIWEVVVPEEVAYSWYGVCISADGTRVSANGKFHGWILDASNGDVIWDGEINNTETPIPMSEDGSVIAIASLSTGQVQALAWDASQETYVELWHYTFMGGYSRWCSAVALSADGNTIAAGSLEFLSTGGYDGHAATFETWGTGEPIWVSSSFGDMVRPIAISDDGLTIAVGSWGDMENTLTDLRVYEKYTSTPFYTLNHPGSINSVGISADGKTIFAGGKHVHNRYFGNGGDAYAVSADLGGGTVQGRVTVSGGSPANVKVEVQNANRWSYTDGEGRYAITQVPGGTYTVVAGSPGISTGTQSGVVVTEGGTTTVNFNLTVVGGEPQNVAATSGELTSIPLSWSLVEMDWLRDARNAVGDENSLISSERGRQAATEGLSFPRGSDGTDQADSIRIYRSMITGGPYAHIASVDGEDTTYVDTYNLFPTIVYHYVLTALYPEGESPYSEEVSASLDDSYLIYNPAIPEMTAAVTFDGVLSPGEWDDAVELDISDVFGYDQPDPPQSVYLYMKYDDTNDKLLVGYVDYLNAELDDNEGLGFYVDDDDDDEWSYDSGGAEGNYWAYYHPYGSDLRFRSLSGGPYSSPNYYYFPSPDLAFSDAAGYVSCEVAFPLSFRYFYDIALYGPDKSPGIGAFTISRDASQNAIFNGWWPQNMASIVSYPNQFADCLLPATIPVPPAPVNDLLVTREGSDALRLTWTDPDSGVDNLPLEQLDGLEIWRNGEFLTEIPIGTETYLDEDVLPYGWYEYALRGWVIDQVGNLYGPLSTYAGAYVTADPTITEIAYDDGSYEALYVVSFSYDDNQFAVRYTPGGYPTAVYTISLFADSQDSIEIAVAADNFGLPGDILAGPYLFVPGTTFDFDLFHIPALDQPVITDGDFWIKLLYLPELPGDPAIGMDYAAPDNRSYYYTSLEGWTLINYGDLMIRAGVGDPPVGVSSGEEALPHRYYLAQNSPNPFNPTTVFRFGLAERTRATLSIYDLMGRRVVRLLDGVREAGDHTVIFDASNLASGLYVYRLTTDNFTQCGKMVLMK